MGIRPKHHDITGFLPTKSARVREQPSTEINYCTCNKMSNKIYMQAARKAMSSLTSSDNRSHTGDQPLCPSLSWVDATAGRGGSSEEGVDREEGYDVGISSDINMFGAATLRNVYYHKFQHHIRCENYGNAPLRARHLANDYNFGKPNLAPVQRRGTLRVPIRSTRKVGKGTRDSIGATRVTFAILEVPGVFPQ